MLYIVLGFIVLCVIYGLLTGDCSDDSSYSSSTSEPSNASYENSNRWGLYDSSSISNGNSIDHYGMNGYKGSSHRLDNDIYHYNTNGYQGRSHIESESIKHYGKDNLYDGCSKPNSSGGYDHFDRWGLYTGSSNKN